MQDLQPWGHEILILRPQGLEGMEGAVEALQSHQSVVVDLGALDADQAQRYADFVAGGTAALDGQAVRVSDRVFVFVPVSVHLREI